MFQKLAKDEESSHQKHEAAASDARNKSKNLNRYEINIVIAAFTFPAPSEHEADQATA